MKIIGFIFFIFVFGQTANHILDASKPKVYNNVRHTEPISSALIAQETADQNLETIPEQPVNQGGESVSESTQAAEQLEASEHSLTSIDANVSNTAQPAASQTETPEKESTPQETERRVLQVINDFQLDADEILTTLVLIAADARLQGRITGKVLVIGGEVHLSPAAQVDGALQIIGGRVTGDIQGVAKMEISNDWLMVREAAHLIMRPHVFWGTSKQTNFRLTFIKFGVSVLMYLLIAALLSNPINAVSDLFAKHPIGSIIFGILLLGLIPLALTFLTLSIIGVPFMLLAVSLLFPLAIFGKASIFFTLGGSLFSRRWRPFTVVFGYVFYFMATSLPYIDWIVFLLVNSVAIGLCLLSGIRIARSQEPRRNVSWSDKV